VLSLLIVAQRFKHTSPPSKSNPRGSSQSDAARITTRYAAILQREGGDSIWVKRPARPGLDHHAPLLGEVLALGPASLTIISSLKKEAATEGFRLQVSDREDGSAQTQILMLFRGNEAICGWRLREVARLYRVAIVIDDLGQDVKTAQQVLSLRGAITLSVLPRLAASRQTAAEAHRAGREVMLHLPMEALLRTKGSLGEDIIREGMPGVEVERIIASDLDSVPYASGVNNHMGSRATAIASLMSKVMRTLASRRLYFIDSRTTASSVALRAAREAGLPAFYRSVFLDDTESVEYTLGELRELRAAVRKQGVALAIGHPHPTTLVALERFLPELDRDDIELVPPSQIVRLPEVASLSPPRESGIANGDWADK
jgi:polysaccharide deacetylase 2 family uncharacterized protein YibQ